jgi:outer membrane receptor protein involved in Fe transport
LTRSALSAGTLLVLLAPPAIAAGDLVYEFHIPSKPIAEALIDFAVQSNLSVGGIAACPGVSATLTGSFTVDDGLKRLLAGAGCRFRRVASNTIRILPPAKAGAGPPTVASRAPPLGESVGSPAILQEVVVTATKRAAEVDQLPYSVSALGHDALRVAGATDIEDVAVQLASLATTNLGPGRDKILLRGLSDGAFTGRTQSTVGLYLDNVPITYNAPDPDLHLGDLDSIEVLRGPQGTLYGGGTMSGIYRIVTHKPDLGELSGSVRGGGELTLGGAASNEEEGVVNVPLIGDRVAARAIVYQDVDGGYISDINLHQSNVDTSVRTGGRGAVLAELGPTWTLNTSYAVQSIHSDDTQYITPDLGRLHRANQVRETSSNDFYQGAISLEKTADWGDLQSTTSYVRHKYATQSDASTALPLFGATTSNVGAYDEPSKVDMAVEDIVWTSPSVGRLQWLGGLFGSVTRETTDSFVRANDANGSPAQVLYQEYRTDSLGEAAAYGEATLSLTQALQATLGARASFNTVHTKSDVEDPQTQRQRLFDGSTPNTGISPKFALSYRLPANQLLYLSVEEGHRPGGFNTGGLIGTVFATNTNTPGIHRMFGADQLWNYEIGAKLKLFRDRLRLRSAIFYNSWNNIQTDQFLASGLSYTTNAGDGRDIGFETEAELRLTPNWSVKANVLVDQPQLTRAAPGFISGVNLPGVPDLLTGARTEYQHHLFGHFSGLLSADARYVGRSQLTFDPKITAPMGGYVLARLSAQLVAPRWRLAVFLSNPTNEAGNTFSYGNPFNYQQVREVTPQRPRSVRLLLSADF